jgi:hypothetical protein
MGLWTALFTSFGSLVLVSAAPPAAECLNGLGPALLAGGFTGSVDCQNDKIFVQNVGKVRKFDRVFQIYSYQYQLKPACADCAVHGEQRLIFMERGRYIGQYKPDFVQATLRNGELVLVPAGPEAPVTVQFTKDGPPRTLWVDGEVIRFFR